MSSQSTYVYNENPAGLGRISIRETDPELYVDRMNSHSERILKPVPVMTSEPVIQPIITTTSKPRTGGSHPIINSNTNTSSKPSDETITRNPLVKIEGDQIVINGNHRIEKKKAALVGGGLIGAAVLLKLVL